MAFIFGLLLYPLLFFNLLFIHSPFLVLLIPNKTSGNSSHHGTPSAMTGNCELDQTCVGAIYRSDITNTMQVKLVMNYADRVSWQAFEGWKGGWKSAFSRVHTAQKKLRCCVWATGEACAKHQWWFNLTHYSPNDTALLYIYYHGI